MQIATILHQSLVDYPGVLSSVIFTYGCNFRCWYCHNHWLVLPHSNPDFVPVDQAIAYLRTRKGWIDGVVISGGEPTLHPDLPDFIRAIKGMGFRVKLDTNGTNPEMILNLINSNLIDFIAMDIKTIPVQGMYSRIVGVDDKDIVRLVRETINVIIDSGISHQFRTTQPEEPMDSHIDEIKQNYLFGQELRVNALSTNNGILSDYLI